MKKIVKPFQLTSDRVQKILVFSPFVYRLFSKTAVELIFPLVLEVWQGTSKQSVNAKDLQRVKTCLFDETWPYAGTVWFCLKSCQTDRNPSPSPLSSLSPGTFVCVRVCGFFFFLSSQLLAQTWHCSFNGRPTCPLAVRDAHGCLVLVGISWLFFFF